MKLSIFFFLFAVIQSALTYFPYPCSYKCDNGAAPKGASGKARSTNGCGAKGAQLSKNWMIQPEMEKCCNQHDYCYDTCNSSKFMCDAKFRSCLTESCMEMVVNIARPIKDVGDFFMRVLEIINPAPAAVNNVACLATGEAMYKAVTDFGCPAFIDAQKDKCVC